jgi:hypothetical protein
VQIYTDNKAADANPKYTGNPAVNDGSGLVDTLTTTRNLPMAWTIHADNTAIPAPADPVTLGTWFPFMDAASPAFSNGAQSLTVKNNQGIQFDFAKFGALQVPPNAIYLEANFGSAVTPRTYQTSTVRLEYFTL